MEPCSGFIAHQNIGFRDSARSDAKREADIGTQGCAFAKALFIIAGEVRAVLEKRRLTILDPDRPTKGASPAGALLGGGLEESSLHYLGNPLVVPARPGSAGIGIE